MGCVGLLIFVSVVGCATEVTVKQQSEAEGHYKLAQSYYNVNPQKAIVGLEKAIHVNPNHANAHMQLGVIYYYRGSLDVAEGHYKQALRIDPDHSDAHNNLGTLYSKKAQWDEAIEEYRKALKNPMYLHPDTAYYNLAGALIWTCQYDEAFIALEEAKKIVPLSTVSLVQIYQEFGRLYSKVGDIELARVSYQEAIEADDTGTYTEQLEEALQDLETTSGEEDHCSPKLN